MKKLLLVADNRVYRNVGCRGTSIALRDILSAEFFIQDIITREELLSFAHILEPKNYTGRKLEKLIPENPGNYKEISDRITSVDAVVINGEGSFIFSDIPREDMPGFLAIFQMCIEQRKPFFLVNAMFSKSSDREENGVTQTECNKFTLDETMKLLKHAALVTVRDMESFDFVTNCDPEGLINLKYLPDALFGLYNFFNNDAETGCLDDALKLPQFSLPHNRCEDFCPNVDFESDYILFSGGSFAAKYHDDMLQSFLLVAESLKKLAREYDMNFYLLEACDGDSPLRLEIPKLTGIPYIPVTTNIFLLGRILGRSRCYVSGRYHPSIFASLGGAPCVFMGSNSHKTSSLQGVLGYPEDERRVFGAIPGKDEIAEIVESARRCIERWDREAIKRVCKANCESVRKLPQMMSEFLK